MTAFASLLASIAVGAPARASCVAARTSASIGQLPDRWRAAVDDLIRSTAEPGHPWSCSGGVVDLELVAGGAVLRIARKGEETVSRQVSSPEDVLPLGQALLATPLAPSSDSGELAAVAAPDHRPAPKQELPSLARETPPTPTSESASSPSNESMRLIVGGGVDSRFVGGSNVGWIGPTVHAAVTMGRWLPSISLRQQSSFGHRGSIDEVSMAIVVQSRFEISPLELRAGLAIRGASVQRDLRGRRGEQGRLEARIGAVTAVALPVLRWLNVVVSVDADVVGVSRETIGPAPTDEPSRSFPTYTVGGSACLEVPL